METGQVIVQKVSYATEPKNTLLATGVYAPGLFIECLACGTRIGE